MTPNGQRGQVAVLFAFALAALIGVIALALDFGFLSDQHRNVQAFADEAAMAGATQLNPAVGTSSSAAQQKAARRAAFINIRENLTGGAGAAAITMASLPACWGPSASRFSIDVTDCPLPAPYDNYRFSICTPAQSVSTSASCQGGLAANTLSVKVNEAVLSSLEGVIGSPTSTAGAFSAAEFTETAESIPGPLGGSGGPIGGGGGVAGPGGAGSGGGVGSGNARPGVPGLPPAPAALGSYRLSFALYSSGCVNTGAKTELIGGDVYIGKCGLSLGSGVTSSFCAESTFATAGNIIFGPDATVPTSPIPLAQQSLASCTTVTAGTTLAMGSVDKVAPGKGYDVPAYPPPPTASGTSGFVAFNPVASYGPARAGNQCANGTVLPNGGSPTDDCFNPGYYSTIGAGFNEDNTSNTSGRYSIHNNLNPGVYYITGTSGCYRDSSKTNCPGVTFADNTMNANWDNVSHACWAAPNIPTTGTFVGNCPDGFVFDPTSPTVTDPMCRGASPLPLVTPTFTATPALAIGGTLGSLAGTPYGVRVTASNAFGESTSTEATVTVTSPLNNSINITINQVPTATRYSVYLNQSPLPLGGEQLLTTVADSTLPTTAVSALVEGSGLPYPRYDTSSCRTGFRNIPTSPDKAQNNGVTFVLLRKAGICFNPDCGPAAARPTPTVLLSPYCSTNRKLLPVNLAAGQPTKEIPLPPPAPNPAITEGTPCPQAYGYPGDGAYIIYGDTTGQIESANLGTQTGVTGTIFAPFASLYATNQTALEIIEGQAILGQVLNLDTANPLTPVVYFPCCPAPGAGAPPGPAAGKNLGGVGGPGPPGPPGADGGGSAVGGPPPGQGVPADLLGGVKPAYVRLIR